MSIFSKVIGKVFGNKADKDLKALSPYTEQINSHYKAFSSLQDQELQDQFTQIQSNFLTLIENNKNELSKANLSNEEVDNKLYELERKFLDENMINVFALIKDACRRLCGKKYMVMGQEVEWNMIPYDVQLIGGIVLHQGKIAEMKTGEGKTLVSTLAIILNAITGRGLHVITVNDYLAERDSQWMGILYKFLGLSVGCILNQMDSKTRKDMYNKDITYGTNSQFGFDYLRDNMASNIENQVQRGHAFAIVDEVDSVLIDEARTPLIISGQIESQKDEQYTQWRSSVESLIRKQKSYVNDLLDDVEELLETDKKEAGKRMLLVQRGVPKNKKLLKLYQKQGIKQLIGQVESEYIRDKKMQDLDEELYFSIDEKSNIIDLSEKGREFLSPSEPENFVIPDLGDAFHNIEEKLSDKNKIALEKEKIQALHSERSEKIHAINQLLRAYSLFEKDVEYIVQDGKVLIVDQHTGRVMHGRQFSDGMHQAIEAKENVAIQRETQTVATITIQNYFRMYEKLSGMTGTALTEAPEFMQIYGLDVVEIPTNQSIQRIDHEDLIYKTKKEKYKAIIDKIYDLYNKGQPILVGTTSVEESETLSKMLKTAKLPHNVLNAKQHQREAEIVARAGLKNSITISTNMAGRGTDIKLGEGVKDLGGLFILGTGRHESRRIDLQLRGRAGRQGDKGDSMFFLSLEDDLMRLFGSDRIAKVMDTLGIKEGEVITHSMITKSIERAQKKIEAMNFASRKNIIEYDDVMNYQREVVYNRRNFSLHEENISIELNQIIDEHIDDILDDFCSGNNFENWDLSSLKNEILNVYALDFEIDESLKTKQDLKLFLNKGIGEIIKFKQQNFDSTVLDQFQRFIILKTIDREWQDHLYMMDQLREGIGLRAYGQKNPLVEYKHEGFAMFESMMKSTNSQTLKRIFRTDLSSLAQRSMDHAPQARNIQTQKDQNILDSLSPHRESQDISSKAAKPAFMNQRKPIIPGQKKKPVVVDKKIGRNDKVLIKRGIETKTIKFKKADAMLKEGWQIVDS
ncbi:MAG: preprotein translocase subunit SecA [Candidatus Marinimicrobia bacterium]|nr:preprotein translocase subunit SecA [Candidatus Neomarinimicrobiota bacterium]|tara:strand:- start:416 stop:3499 length:3084 start_codon:yes stop_codon:yes gene_type:complete